MSEECPPEILLQIIRKFSIPDIDSYHCDISVYGNGHIHKTYLVTFIHIETSTEKKFVLQRINDTIFTDVSVLMKNISLVTSYLQAHGIMTLKLIPPRSDNKDEIMYLKAPCGGYWRVYEYVRGCRAVGDVPALEDAQAAAYAFGQFQYALRDFPIDKLEVTIKDFHNTRMRFEAFKKAAQEDRLGRAVNNNLHVDIDFLMSREGRYVDILESQRASGAIPLRVVHNDTKLNNVLLDNISGDPLCVVDLDTVMPGLALHDFGDMVRSSVNTCPEDEPDSAAVHMNLSMFEAVARGYLGSNIGAVKGQLIKAEIDHLVIAAQVITYEQALRFMTDYLLGDIYYATDPARGGAHNLHRARCQCALLLSMESQEKLMQAIVEKIRAANSRKSKQLEMI
mmetsp:Transcript_22155/g.32247  ORF Transcript_22155/g.32247 Transcript_22155/m.32247 type:complete len:395 (-) Transcript_22155:39-1223(-)